MTTINVRRCTHSCARRQEVPRAAFPAAACVYKPDVHMCCAGAGAGAAASKACLAWPLSAAGPGASKWAVCRLSTCSGTREGMHRIKCQPWCPGHQRLHSGRTELGGSGQAKLHLMHLLGAVVLSGRQLRKGHRFVSPARLQAAEALAPNALARTLPSCCQGTYSDRVPHGQQVGAPSLTSKTSTCHLTVLLPPSGCIRELCVGGCRRSAAADDNCSGGASGQQRARQCAGAAWVWSHRRGRGCCCSSC